jgi:hypothetical protein
MGSNAMKLDRLLSYPEVKFRRYTGIGKQVFRTMRDYLVKQHAKKHEHGGRRSSLPVGVMLMMALEYWREYPSYLRIGMNYHVSESTAYRVISWVEDTLVGSGMFNLPGRKALLNPDNPIETVLIDATEIAIERPKKNNVNFILARKSATRLKRRLWWMWHQPASFAPTIVMEKLMIFNCLKIAMSPC